MMIRTIVLDDEWYNLEEICELVENSGFMRVVGRYQNPLMALEEVSHLMPQVALIDIEMPEMDGITLAEKLLEKNPSMMIAFITSWNQYAVQAFDLNALDYIMKPVKEDRFHRMIDKIRKEIDLIAPIESKNIFIKCYDRLEVSIGGMPVKWERAKAEELFAYLLINHDSYVHKDIVIEDLWPEYAYAKALPILQTAICKIRNIFSQVSNEVKLDYSGSKYCLAIKNVQCDYYEVEKALSNYKNGKFETFHAVEEACSICSNGFLAQQGYLWSAAKNEDMSRKFAAVMREIINAYSIMEMEADMARAMKLLVQLTPYDEELNHRLLHILWRQGAYDSFYEHYKWLEKVLKESYDITLPDLIRELERKLSGGGSLNGI